MAKNIDLERGESALAHHTQDVTDAELASSSFFERGGQREEGAVRTLADSDLAVAVDSVAKLDAAPTADSSHNSVRSYLRAPVKKVALTTVRSLHPKDWMLLFFFLYTTPVLFIGADSARHVVWGGIALRLLVTPTILFLRYYLAVVPDDLHVRRRLLNVGKTRTLVLVLPYMAGFVLDIIHILCCVYFYTEEGLIIKNLWAYPADFYDDRLKEVDYQITGVSVQEGVGHYLRSLTGHGSTTNRALGEYLSACYIFFYGVIFLTYIIPYIWAPRYNFDQMTTGLVLSYLVCLALFFLLPTAGPYWQYPDQRPTGKEIGYFFGPLSQTLIEGGSSIGTAFPSSHCAITTACFVLSLVYMWPLGVAYILVCPAIVFATIWLGNHYVIDSLVGVCIGLVCSAVTIIIGKFWLPKVQKPLTGDNMYVRTMVTLRKTPTTAATADAKVVGSESSTLGAGEHVAQLSARGDEQVRSDATLEDVCVDVDAARYMASSAYKKPAPPSEVKAGDTSGQQ